MSRETEDDGGEDSDHTFLDDVLNRLYDFGDGTRGGRKKKSLKTKRKKCNDNVTSTSADSCNATKDDAHECMHPSGHNIAVAAVSESCKIENTSLALKKPSQVEIVTFQDPSKKKKTKKAPTPEIKLPPAEEKKKVDQNDISLEKARLEVHRFGITGYQKEQQRHFEQERAIMLGAKPPKREYINYKVYQEMIKEKKLKAKEELKLDNKKKKKRESKGRDEKRKTSSSSLPTGQVGRFKNGMLLLSSKEIQRVKSSKVIK
ncbi:hypothetical protein AAFF_G00020630 [Aldrovandia affinis]|uniref:Uncharacterized protein n=1 Tax=Aldrovandia affinis TaxID=143900 RepID=A0AAD7S594_9TELE|nr:hypothetical protein AAFF_G00020630 [Aldrovandia affinis]